MSKATPHLVGRLRRLGRDRTFLLLEAAGTLAAVSLALHLLSFKRVIRLGSVALRGQSSASADHCIWAVETAARHVPWRVVCIQQGIAAQRMLRRRGVDAILHYGISNRRKIERLEAHVWVTVEGEMLIGGAEAPNFAPVAAYP